MSQFFHSSKVDPFWESGQDRRHVYTLSILSKKCHVLPQATPRPSPFCTPHPNTACIAMAPSSPALTQFAKPVNSATLK